MPDGTEVTIAGVLTTDLGALEAGRSAFVQDPTGGIALYLDAVAAAHVAIGSNVVVRGTIDDRFAQRTLRAAEADIEVSGGSALPVGLGSSTGAAVSPSRVYGSRSVRRSSPAQTRSVTARP